MIDNSFLTNSQFRIQIGDNQTTKRFNFNVVGANIPGFESTPISMGVNHYQNMEIGETLVWNPLGISILMDEKMEAYQEIYCWIYDNCRDNSRTFHDVTLDVLTSSNNTVRRLSLSMLFRLQSGKSSF
jgi:hypothetical protein